MKSWILTRLSTTSQEILKLSMKKIFLILTLFAHCAFAQSIIKKIEIFDRGNNIDVMFFSNSIFTSSPQEFNIQDEKIILLKNSQSSQKIKKEFSSSILKSIEIFSKNKDIYIIPKSKLPFKVQASKSKDAYTLRIRFVPIKTIDNISSIIEKSPSIKPQSLNIAQPSNMGIKDYQYWLVLIVMIMLILIMLFVRKKFSPINNKTFFNAKSSKLEILSSKNIDANNKILTIGNEKYEYIILLGNKQNILIDKISLDHSSSLTKESPNPSKNKLKQNKIASDNFWAYLKQK